MNLFNKSTAYQPEKTLMTIRNDMEICQSDYPIDWYQEEFIPYAEAYQALPDRKLTTILSWMTPYLNKAQDHFGDQLLYGRRHRPSCRTIRWTNWRLLPARAHGGQQSAKIGDY